MKKCFECDAEMESGKRFLPLQADSYPDGCWGHRTYTDRLDEKTQRQLFLGVRDLVLKHYKEEYLMMLSPREREIAEAIVKLRYIFMEASVLELKGDGMRRYGKI